MVLTVFYLDFSFLAQIIRHFAQSKPVIFVPSNQIIQFPKNQVNNPKAVLFPIFTRNKIKR